MVLTLLLPWFPIILAVGVGGRLLGRSRGLGMGVLCALFWVVLVQASVGVLIWRDPLVVATMVAGAVAIAAMGSWAGEHRTQAISPCGAASESPAACGSSEEPTALLVQLSAAVDQFDDWLDRNRLCGDPWPAFDECLRSLLYQCCRATHVKTYRLLPDDQYVTPLHLLDPFHDEERISARSGIIGHVVTTGRSYLAGDHSQGELLNRLAGDGSPPVVWCFPIRAGTRRLGVITAGQLDIAPQRHRPFLRAVEQIVNQFWCTVAEVTHGRSAERLDPVSGLYTRPALLVAMEEAMGESYARNEPVAVAVIALEGLREINDAARWETADELVGSAGKILRAKLRSDDRVGRFDDSRFVMLLRRVDSELASLIVTQLLDRLGQLAENAEHWKAAVRVRCGVAGSGTKKPDLRTLLSRALIQWRRAREENLPIAGDLNPATTLSGALS